MDINLDLVKMVQEKNINNNENNNDNLLEDFEISILDRVKEKSVKQNKMRIFGELYVGKNEKILTFVGDAIDCAIPYVRKILIGASVAVIGTGIGQTVAGINAYNDYEVAKLNMQKKEIDNSYDNHYFNEYLNQNEPTLEEKIDKIEEISDTRKEISKYYENEIDRVLNYDKEQRMAIQQVAEKDFNKEFMDYQDSMVRK